MDTNPFLHFDKVYVISEKNSERRQYVRKILEDLNVPFQFFDAIMGKNLTEDDLSVVYDDNLANKHKTIGKSLSKPEIGCTMSHMAIYKEILSEDLDHALIFEDDIDPVYKNINLVNNAIADLPKNWDLLHLGVLDHYRTPPISFKLKMLLYYPFLVKFHPNKLNYSYRHLKNIYPRPYSIYLKQAGYHMGAQAYAVSKRGAQKILSANSKIVTIIDRLISVMAVEEQINAFMTKEIIFDQNKSFESTILNK